MKDDSELRENDSRPREQLREDERFKSEVLPQWEREMSELRTPEDLARFVHHLMDDYEHDYGTVCYALGYAAVAGATVANRHPHQGGITGFQAGFVMWLFIQKWLHEEGPLALVRYSNMLYPQYEDRFEKTISKGTWEWLQAEAKKYLAEHAENFPHPNVMAHWQSIVDGVVPFGFTVKDD